MEIFEIILLLIDLFASILDCVGWVKAKDNRIQRKKAKLEGIAKPPRDQWSWIVLILTPSIVLITCYLIWRF